MTTTEPLTPPPVNEDEAERKARTERANVIADRVRNAFKNVREQFDAAGDAQQQSTDATRALFRSTPFQEALQSDTGGAKDLTANMTTRLARDESERKQQRQEVDGVLDAFERELKLLVERARGVGKRPVVQHDILPDPPIATATPKAKEKLAKSPKGAKTESPKPKGARTGKGKR